MRRYTERHYMSPARKEPDTRIYSGRFAARLRMLREKAGVTQEDVAVKLGITVRTVYKWEQGVHFPTPDQLPLLKELFGLKSVQALFPKD